MKKTRFFDSFFNHSKFPLTASGFVLIAILAVPASANYTNHIGMEFINIPQGDFFMGSCGGDVFLQREVTFSGNLGKMRRNAGSMLCRCDGVPDPEANKQEFPQRKVLISRKVQMAATETTVGQFMEFVRLANRQDFMQDELFQQANQTSEDHPVTNVSWEDAVAFARWLNTSKHRSDKSLYRLPTEAEWEYAARAARQSHYSYGNDPAKLDEYAWFDYNSPNNANKVKTKRPNKWNLYDMSGNVWEWVYDWHGRYSEKIPNTNPTGPVRGEKRVLRGGSWKSSPKSLRSAARASGVPGLRADHVGFRLVRELR